VDRVICKGHTYEADLSLDVANEVFPVKVGERLSLALTTTLHLDGRHDEGVYMPSGTTGPSLLDRYDYGMHGKVFRVQHREGSV
jgi:DNA-directed RNA polymerase I, II, and III subunit RPABC3